MKSKINDLNINELQMLLLWPITNEISELPLTQYR